MSGWGFFVHRVHLSTFSLGWLMTTFQILCNKYTLINLNCQLAVRLRAQSRVPLSCMSHPPKTPTLNTKHQTPNQTPTTQHKQQHKCTTTHKTTHKATDTQM